MCLLWNLIHISLKLILLLIKQPNVNILLLFIQKPFQIINLCFNKRVLIDFIVIISLNGGFEYIFKKFIILETYLHLKEWFELLHNNNNNFYNSIKNNNWNIENLQLNYYYKEILYPLFQLLFVKPVLILLISNILSYFTKFLLISFSLLLQTIHINNNSIVNITLNVSFHS